MRFRTQKTITTSTHIPIQCFDIPLQPGNVVFLGVDNGLQLVNTGFQSIDNLKQCLPFRRHVINLSPATIVLLIQKNHVFSNHPHSIVQHFQVSLDCNLFFSLLNCNQVNVDLREDLFHPFLIRVEVSFSTVILQAKPCHY